MRGYQEYYQYTTCHPEGEREWQALLKLLLNHETSFLRHLPSFEALNGYALPALVSDAQRGNTLTMWSVGCSIGQEAYALAMAFLELSTPAAASDGIRLGDGAQARWQARLIASDTVRRFLDKAYKMRSLLGTMSELLTALGGGIIAFGSY
jgi:chemotaxis methyl-accepting protein methylase